MKLGVFNPLFNDKSFEEMLDYVQASGVEAVEVGTGGYPGSKHIDVDQLLEDEAAREAYLKAFAEHGLLFHHSAVTATRFLRMLISVENQMRRSEKQSNWRR